jgi:hypothetical protein
MEADNFCQNCWDNNKGNVIEIKREFYNMYDINYDDNQIIYKKT